MQHDHKKKTVHNSDVIVIRFVAIYKQIKGNESGQNYNGCMVYLQTDGILGRYIKVLIEI